MQEIEKLKSLVTKLKAKEGNRWKNLVEAIAVIAQMLETLSQSNTQSSMKKGVATSIPEKKGFLAKKQEEKK